MTIVDEWRAWQAVCEAVEARDVQAGARPDAADDIYSDTPLLAACAGARDTVEGLVFNGGQWQGRWIPALRRRRA